MNDFMKKFLMRMKMNMVKEKKCKMEKCRCFLLQDCTVVLSLNDKKLSVKVTADKPIKCDFASSMFVESEE